MGFVSRTERVLKSNEGAFFRGDLLVGFDIRDVLDLVRVRWAMGTGDKWRWAARESNAGGRDLARWGGPNPIFIAVLFDECPPQYRGLL